MGRPIKSKLCNDEHGLRVETEFTDGEREDRFITVWLRADEGGWLWVDAGHESRAMIPLEALADTIKGLQILRRKLASNQQSPHA